MPRLNKKEISAITKIFKQCGINYYGEGYREVNEYGKIVYHLINFNPEVKTIAPEILKKLEKILKADEIIYGSRILL